MLRASWRSPGVAVGAAVATCVWLNQGPSMRRYEALVRDAETHPALVAWLPLAFLYRRSADEELYFATTNAIRGIPFDEALLAAKRGESTEPFAHLPRPDGLWHRPYSEVPMEYPPLVLPFLLLPALLTSTFEGFAAVFGLLMASLLLIAIALVSSAGATRADRSSRWWLAVGLLLAQGGLAVQRIDAVVAVLLALAVWAAARERHGLMGFAVGLAGAAKIVPALVLLPLLALRRKELRAKGTLARVAIGFGAALGLGILPWLIGPGFAAFAGYHRSRGLHVESTFGVVLSVVELAGGVPGRVTLSFGSYNLEGPIAGALASVSTPLLVASVATLSVWLARRAAPPTQTSRPEALAGACLATLACVWMLGKVFSPQYMTWAIPLVVAIANRRIALLFGVSIALSQAYLRGFYDAVVAMHPLAVSVLALRLALLVAMAAAILGDLARLTRPPSDPKLVERR